MKNLSYDFNCICDNNELLYVRFINLTKLEYGGIIYKKKFKCSAKLEHVKKLYYLEFIKNIQENNWNILTDIIILVDNVCDKIYVFNKPEYYLLYHDDDNYFIINEKEKNYKNISKNFISVENILETKKDLNIENKKISYFSFENYRSKSCCIL